MIIAITTNIATPAKAIQITLFAVKNVALEGFVSVSDGPVEGLLGSIAGPGNGSGDEGNGDIAGGEGIIVVLKGFPVLLKIIINP